MPIKKAVMKNKRKSVMSQKMIVTTPTIDRNYLVINQTESSNDNASVGDDVATLAKSSIDGERTSNC